MQFPSSEFRCVEAGSASLSLFKMAAQDRINKQQNTHVKEEISIKYQVLCDETALVGVIKELDRATGQLKMYEVSAEKEIPG